MNAVDLERVKVLSNTLVSLANSIVFPITLYLSHVTCWIFLLLCFSYQHIFPNSVNLWNDFLNENNDFTR